MNARERLNQVLEAVGAQAKRSLGQNFLVSDNVIDKIIQAAKGIPAEQLLEIGPGPGALTFWLRQLGIPLTLIELDNKFSEYWKAEGLRVLHEDALQLDWQNLLNSAGSTVLVSNLPYQISSSIVIDRSVDQHQLSGMVLMFQKEVAQRIRSLPRTENYGLLSVIAQTFWDVSMVTEAGPRDFSPPPRVASRVLQFLPKACTIKNRNQFLKIIKACFAQRRKLMKSNLGQTLHQYHRSEEELIDWLKRRGHPPTARAEELSIADFVELYYFFLESPSNDFPNDSRSSL